MNIAQYTEDNDQGQTIDMMRHALRLASRAELYGEVPVGALIVFQGAVIAEAWNERETSPSALAHAELTAIHIASRKLGRWRLTGCSLFVTLEPCLMCAGALVQARIDQVFYGAPDPKGGAVESIYRIFDDDRLNHRPGYHGRILAEDCGNILTQFFRRRRSESSESTRTTQSSQCETPSDQQCSTV